MILLIINDERLNAETIKTDIPWRQYGIDEVHTAYDAHGAMKAIRSMPVDLMLCDIEMPGENGIELLRWARECYPEIECIFLTCHASFEYAKEAIGLGCQDYLLMPAPYDTIGDAVWKVVQRIKTRRTNEKYQEYGKQVMQEKLTSTVESHGDRKSSIQIVQEVKSYVREHLENEELTVNEVANQLYLHPVYLNRLFKKEMETSVGQYIIAERMKLAAELLKTGKMSANSVATQVGYQSYCNFNIMFQRYYGCTPKQYSEQAMTL